MPAQRITCERRTAGPARSANSGSTVPVMISRISAGTPAIAYSRVPPGRVTTSPGAVPRSGTTYRAPSGTSACRRLLAGISPRYLANRSRSIVSSSGCRTIPTPITRAIASRVMSSPVGPRPPVTRTTSTRSAAAPSVATIRSMLSPTTEW